MKVIFIADVPNVALAGQTKEVANGYARNFLFPRKLAVLANSQAATVIESHVKKAVKQREVVAAEMSELAKKINGVEITLKAKVHEENKLYGSVNVNDIAEELGKQVSLEIDKRKIDLAEPIREVGIYDVSVKLHHDISAMITVVVMSDAEGAEKPVKVEEAEASAEEVKEEAKEAKEEKAEKKAKKPRKKKETKKEETAAAEKAEEPVKEAASEAEKEKKEKKPAKGKKKEKKPKAKKEEEAVEAKKEPEQGE